jgi:hypothetical protein
VLALGGIKLIVIIMLRGSLSYIHPVDGTNVKVGLQSVVGFVCDPYCYNTYPPTAPPTARDTCVLDSRDFVISSHQITSYYPILSYPILSCPALSCPVLPCPVLSCPVLSCPVLSCPVMSCPVLSCPILSYPILFYLSWVHPTVARRCTSHVTSDLTYTEKPADSLVVRGSGG